MRYTRYRELRIILWRAAFVYCILRTNRSEANKVPDLKSRGIFLQDAYICGGRNAQPNIPVHALYRRNIRIVERRTLCFGQTGTYVSRVLGKD